MDLSLHPDSQCDTVSKIEADVVLNTSGVLDLSYRITGAIADLVIPVRLAPGRADELWRHSCFEFFIRPEGREGYFEFNLSPSTQWAAYRFDAYRQGMHDAAVATPPVIECRAETRRLELMTSLRPDAFPDIPDLARSLIGLSAVIEERRGRKSYWALAHPPGAPDFHHPESFSLNLSCN